MTKLTGTGHIIREGKNFPVSYAIQTVERRGLRSIEGILSKYPDALFGELISNRPTKLQIGENQIAFPIILKSMSLDRPIPFHINVGDLPPDLRNSLL